MVRKFTPPPLLPPPYHSSKNHDSILPTLPFLWGKSETPTFFWKFQKLNSPLYKRGGRVPVMYKSYVCMYVPKFIENIRLHFRVFYCKFWSTCYFWIFILNPQTFKVTISIKITELITSDNIYITTTQRCYRQYYCIGRCERKPAEGKKNLIALHNNIDHTTIKTYLAWMNEKKQQPHFNSF